MDNSKPGPEKNPRPNPPRGNVLHAQFSGILEGFAGDPSTLEDTVAKINGTRIASVDLEIDGGQFSLLFDNKPITGALVTTEAQQRLLELLGELVATVPAPEAVESTVACKVVHEDGVVETILSVENGELRPLSRIRERQDRDVLPIDESERFAAPLQQLGARKGIFVAALLLVAFGLLAWRSGYIGRILSKPADQLTSDLSSFEELLEIKTEKKWGKYKVTIMRGPKYPVNSDEAEQLRRNRKAADKLAALDIVAKGDHLYVQLCNKAGFTISSAKAELRPLLSREDGQVTVHLDGNINAHILRLSLGRGDKN